MSEVKPIDITQAAFGVQAAAASLKLKQTQLQTAENNLKDAQLAVEAATEVFAHAEEVLAVSSRTLVQEA